MITAKSTPSTALQTTTPPLAQDYLPTVDPKAVEQALLIGDISQMSDEVRIAYYVATCRSLGLNPLTKPFQALKTDDGKVTLYPDKGCAEQLRKLHRVSVHVVKRQILDDLYIVTVRATTPDGREEESQGIVPIAKPKGTWEEYEYRGEKKRRFKAALDQEGHEIMVPLSAAERANAMMRGETKAKRRVTLAICGLGLPDTDSEDEGHPMALDLHTKSIEAEAEGQKSVSKHTADMFGDQDAVQATLEATRRRASAPSETPGEEENATPRQRLAEVQAALGWTEGQKNVWENTQARWFRKSFNNLPDATIAGLIAELEQQVSLADDDLHNPPNLPLGAAQEAHSYSPTTGGEMANTPNVSTGALEGKNEYHPLSAWRDTLEAHKDNGALPEALRAKVRLALNPASETTDTKGLALASAVLDTLAAQEA